MKQAALPNKTDLRILAEFILHNEPISPVKGEFAAFNRLLSRGFLIRLGQEYGTGEWYIISRKGERLINQMVSMIEDF